MLKKLFAVVVALAGVLFIVMGLRWLVDPGNAAVELGLTLESGVGLSSQIGDLAAFFLTVGLCVLGALASKRRIWYYPAIALLLLAALGRIIAWVVHDAALALNLIAPEIVIAVILIVASRILPEHN